jgi:hypothetical protein
MGFITRALVFEVFAVGYVLFIVAVFVAVERLAGRFK